MPSSVQLSDSRSATYLYDAAGIKRRVIHQGGGENKMTECCSNVIYENKMFNKVLTDEGYLTVVNHPPIYHYYLKDHLGNNRVVLNQDGTTVEQVSHYYPFGGVFDQTAEDAQRYKFGGKELDRTYGLDLYDYSARYMDGALGRFTTMDPMAEKYYGISPYAYCANNPMRFVDPTGMLYDDYRLNRDGVIEFIRPVAGDDVLYATSENGVVLENNSITAEKGVDGSSLISQLANNKKGKTNYAVGSNSDEASSLFVFASNNTDVEWGLSEFRDGNNVITTSHSDVNVATAISVSGYNEEDMLYKVHSHPGKGAPRGASNASGLTGDMDNIINMAHRFNEKGIYTEKKFPKHFIYHPDTKLYISIHLIGRA